MRGQDTMVNKRDYVELGLACADVCGALDRGVGGRQLDQLSRSSCEAIGKLTTWVRSAMYILFPLPTTTSIAGL